MDNTIGKVHPVKRVSIFQERGARYSSLLKEGEVISGKILEKLNSTNYLIRIKGHHLVAESENPLTEGEEKTFIVLKSEPKIELKLIDNVAVDLKGKENKIQLLKMLDIPVNKSTLAILNIIESFQSQITVKEISYLFSLFTEIVSGKEPTKNELSTIKILIYLIKNKIPLDGKTALIIKNHLLAREKILSLVDEYGRKNRESIFITRDSEGKNKIIDLLKSLTDLYKKFQSQQKEAENRFSYLPFPVFFKGKAELAELFIFPDEKNRKGDEDVLVNRLALLIHFEENNPLKITIILKELKDAHIEFESEKSLLLDEFKKHEEALIKAMKEKGIKIAQVAYKNIDDGSKIIGSVYSEYILRSRQKVNLVV